MAADEVLEFAYKFDIVALERPFPRANIESGATLLPGFETNWIGMSRTQLGHLKWLNKRAFLPKQFFPSANIAVPLSSR